MLTSGNSSSHPLICLHSMMTSSVHLLSEVGQLAKHFYLVAPDLPWQSVKGLSVYTREL